MKATDILSQWTNASVEKLDNLFKSFESPSVVFIDEIDAIAKNRDKNQNISEEDIKVLNTFLQYID
ncbi:MAG: AAA family ATPase [bacterium]|nr:AAA family ATPase [bacterium]MDP3380214.1 AAA family ATPase [bacterium]